MPALVVEVSVTVVVVMVAELVVMAVVVNVAVVEAWQSSQCLVALQSPS